MSAIASFYLLDKSKLEELKQHAQLVVKKTLFSRKVTDRYGDFLAANTTELKSFDGPGYIFGNLLVYLEQEKNIDITENEYDLDAQDLIDKRGSSHFFFTNIQRQTFINRLNPCEYSLQEIQQFNKDFSGDGNDETARLTLEAIEVLRDNLSKLQNDSQLLLLIVG